MPPLEGIIYTPLLGSHNYYTCILTTDVDLTPQFQQELESEAIDCSNTTGGKRVCQHLHLLGVQKPSYPPTTDTRRS